MLLSALCLLILALLFDGPLTRAGYAPVGIGLYVAAYLLSGAGVLKKAGRNILHGQIFDENFLMSVASLGALIIGEYPEAAAVMIFYKIGETFEHYAVNRSRRSIQSLMAIRPDTAHRLLEDGGEETVDAFLLQPGDTFLVRPGERVPLDGVVLTGESRLDTSALTGESVPRRAAPGDTVLSGCVNESAALTLRATCSFGESTASRIIDMVENAAARKSRQEAFITRFAAVYTPRCGTSSCVAGDSAAAAFTGAGMERVGVPGTDVFGGIVPVCAGHFGAAELLWRHWRRVAAGGPNKRRPGSGNPQPGGNRGFR